MNDRFEFPETLDLYPYSTEGVAWLDSLEAKKAAKKQPTPAPSPSPDSDPTSALPGADDGGDAEEGDKEEKAGEEEEGTEGESKEGAEEERPYVLHPKEYYEYQLAGVVIHMGTADSGHYYSLIRERGTGPLGAGVIPDSAGIPVQVDKELVTDTRVAAVFAQAEAMRKANAGKWFEFNDSAVTVRVPVVL